MILVRKILAESLKSATLLFLDDISVEKITVAIDEIAAVGASPEICSDLDLEFLLIDLDQSRRCCRFLREVIMDIFDKPIVSDGLRKRQMQDASFRRSHLHEFLGGMHAPSSLHLPDILFFCLQSGF